jgi:hypothetical protein
MCVTRPKLISDQQVLHPYITERQSEANARSVLFLDSYRCHMMTCVVIKIQELEVEVEHIPAGCIGLVQSVVTSVSTSERSGEKEIGRLDAAAVFVSW